MIAEVISIGDELTSGQRLDTNSKWLSEQLGDLGVRVMYHTTVADDLAANIQVFKIAVERADIVVATGGLGPTADDLTRDAMAAVLGVDLVLDDASLEHIKRLFARHKRDMPERNRAQAMFPAGSRPIFNPNGTAPGVWAEARRPGRTPAHLFALPGVPAEMFEMFQQTVAPAVAALSERPRVIRHRRIKCFGVGESHLEQMLPDLIRRGRTPSVGITVHAATITLRVTAEGETPEACYASMESTLVTIRECLGSLVFGEEEDELENAVLRLLAERNQTLATAEWGTRGLLEHWLSEAQGIQQGYYGGVLIAGEAGVASWLGVSEELVADKSGAGEKVAAAMARQARQRFGADYGLAIGAFPEPEAGAAEPPAYHFALATPTEVVVRGSTLSSHPSIWKPRAAKQALNLLRLKLLGE